MLHLQVPTHGTDLSFVSTSGLLTSSARRMSLSRSLQLPSSLASRLKLPSQTRKSVAITPFNSYLVYEKVYSLWFAVSGSGLLCHATGFNRAVLAKYLFLCSYFGIKQSFVKGFLIVRSCLEFKILDALLQYNLFIIEGGLALEFV